jgi:beta-phosphoglucomutase
MSRAFDTYITDLDGTLCDTKEANIAAYQLAFADAGVAFDEEAYRQHFGLRFDDMVHQLAPHSDSLQRQIIIDRKSIHYAEQAGLIELNRPLLRILEHAKASGAKIGLATTARGKNAQAVLDHFNISSLFDAVIFGEDVANGKPDPECYLKAISKLGSLPESTLVFEDSAIGVEAAQRAGAYVVKVAI